MISREKKAFSDGRGKTGSQDRRDKSVKHVLILPSTQRFHTSTTQHFLDGITYRRGMPVYLPGRRRMLRTLYNFSLKPPSCSKSRARRATWRFSSEQATAIKTKTAFAAISG